MRRQDAEGTGVETQRSVDLRTALLWVAALAAGYVAGRRLLGPSTAASESGPSDGELREQADEALPGDDEDGAAGDGEMAGADPTLEEINERTEAEVQSEPAEPGEMHVDEELVEEAVDAEALAGEDDEAGEMAPDEAADEAEREQSEE